jgi:hypothetical protein
MKSKRNLLITGLIFLLFAQPAWAYIDPGAGSALLQGLLAVAAAGIVFFRRGVDLIRLWWAKYGPRSARKL